MNEQLIVKNFGPIKDATVDFKRVTVFIGPTGGGKSTLAKLATIFREDYLATKDDSHTKEHSFNELANHFQVFEYISNKTEIHWDGLRNYTYINNSLKYTAAKPKDKILLEDITLADESILNFQSATLFYIPADRAFAAALENSLAGLVVNDVALPEALLSFINDFKSAQKRLPIRPISANFLDAEYKILDNQPKILVNNNHASDLRNSASGIQATIPMMLVIDNATQSRYRQRLPISFVIEEPELNLYPAAQQGLLTWLVEKCTKGENDLTITTHSPYLLAHFNTLLFAYQVAQNHPKRADEIAKVVPRESWLDPKEFAAYHVEGQKGNGVRSIVNPETGLISYNGLDAIASAEATEFEKLLDINAGLEVEW